MLATCSVLSGALAEGSLVVVCFGFEWGFVCLFVVGDLFVLGVYFFVCLGWVLFLSWIFVCLFVLGGYLFVFILGGYLFVLVSLCFVLGGYLLVSRCLFG